MFRDYQDDIDDIAILYGHTSRSAKGDNRIYALAARRFGKAGTGHFESLVRTDAYSARDRYRSNLSLEVLRSAPPVGEVQRRLKDFLDGVPVALAFSEHSDLEALRRFCGVDRIVDLNFAAEFFLQQLPSFSLVRLWKELMAKQHENMSFSAAELVELAEALIRHICWKDLNDSHRKTAGVIRYYLQRSKTLFGRLCCRLATHYSDFFGDLLSLGTDGDTPPTGALFSKRRSGAPCSKANPVSDSARSGFCGRMRPFRMLSPDCRQQGGLARIRRRPHSTDPLNAARRALLSSDQYWQRCNYDRDIKLRQGIGRLLRSETDRGRVVILDRRFCDLPLAGEYLGAPMRRCA